MCFFFVKRNHIFGIRVRRSFESEEIWHRIHVLAAYWTIPFDVLLLLLLFVDSSATKSLLSFVIFVILMTIYTIIPYKVTNKYFKNKKALEQKELAEQIKKESGWS